MTFRPANKLDCPTCGYRLEFRERILQEISFHYACYCATNKIQDPRLKGGALAFLETDKSGKKLNT